MASLATAASATALLQELVEVEQAVLAAVTDLYMPFAGLVQAQWRGNHPLVRAAFVLTAAAEVAGASKTGAEATAGEAPPAGMAGGDLRRRRVYLAGAIETLRLALRVHTQLLASETPAAIDRSRLGSTVLAGDFCFSRAAGLAAKTGNPVIVDLFAHALQRVSEGSLRGLFRRDEAPYDADRELCVVGIAAAGELGGLGMQVREVHQQVGARLLDLDRAGQAGASGLLGEVLALLPPLQRPPWQALGEWLGGQPPSAG